MGGLGLGEGHGLGWRWSGGRSSPEATLLGLISTFLVFCNPSFARLRHLLQPKSWVRTGRRVSDADNDASSGQERGGQPWDVLASRFIVFYNVQYTKI